MRPHHRTSRLLAAICSGLTIAALATACSNTGDTGRPSEASSSRQEASGAPGNQHTPQASEPATSTTPAQSAPSASSKPSPTVTELVRDAVRHANENNNLIDISLSNNSTCSGIEMVTLTKLQGDWQPGPYVELKGFSNEPGLIALDSMEMHENPTGNPYEHWHFDCKGKKPGRYSVQFIRLDPVQVTESVTITVEPAA